MDYIGPQAELWPDWRHHAFVTDREGDAASLDEDHRRHAVTELAIRDLKEGAGMNHCPSGRFFANSAWLVLAALAHNLLRWTASLGLDIDGPVVAKTIRRRFIALPGRLTRSARKWRLHQLPAAGARDDPPHWHTYRRPDPGEQMQRLLASFRDWKTP